MNHPPSLFNILKLGLDLLMVLAFLFTAHFSSIVTAVATRAAMVYQSHDMVMMINARFLYHDIWKCVFLFICVGFPPYNINNPSSC